jgi:hypothetical protein
VGAQRLKNIAQGDAWLDSGNNLGQGRTKLDYVRLLISREKKWKQPFDCLRIDKYCWIHMFQK